MCLEFNSSRMNRRFRTFRMAISILDLASESSMAMNLGNLEMLKIRFTIEWWIVKKSCLKKPLAEIAEFRSLYLWLSNSDRFVKKTFCLFYFQTVYKRKWPHHDSNQQWTRPEHFLNMQFCMFCMEMNRANWFTYKIEICVSL